MQTKFLSCQRHALLRPNKPDLKPRAEMEKELMFIYDTPEKLKPAKVVEPDSFLDGAAQPLLSDEDADRFRLALFIKKIL